MLIIILKDSELKRFTTMFTAVKEKKTFRLGRMDGEGQRLLSNRVFEKVNTTDGKFYKSIEINSDMIAFILGE